MCKWRMCKVVILFIKPFEVVIAIVIAIIIAQGH